jgi:solute carrier family 30 (zinc transporter), member 5/7
MLPLTANDIGGCTPRFSIKDKVAGWMRLIFSDKDSRNLFLFLCLNFSFAFVELFYGVWTNSLGLISDSFHMFFDCTALLTGLAASMIAKWRSNERYTYGYVRAEIMGGFINALLLIFIAFFIFSEAIERLAEPPEIKHERLFLISVLGFLVNLIGIFVFNHGGAHHGHSHGEESKPINIDNDHGGHGHSHGHGHGHSHGHSHEVAPHPPSHGHGHSHGGAPNQILQGVFLHILADTLGSVGVIISSLLIKYFNWMIADPICSMCIAFLITISILPLLRDSTAILMMRTPVQLENELPACFTKVSQLDGVYSVQEPHFWTLCSDVYVGMLKLEVHKNADFKYLQTQTHSIFYQIGVRQLYVQLDIVSL